MTRKIIKNIRVGEIMSRDVMTVGPDASITEVHELFKKYDYNALPVVSEGVVVGIITKLDLMKAFSTGTTFRRSEFFKSLSENAAEIMRTAIISVSPDDPLKTVVDYMVEFRLRSIPVLKNNQIVGIVSRGDVVDHLVLEDERA